MLTPKRNIFNTTVSLLVVGTIGITGCTTKNKVERLEDENGRLRTELSATKSKAQADLEKAQSNIDELQKKMKEFDISSETLTALTNSISEQQAIKAGLEQTLAALGEQKVQAEKQIAEAAQSREDAEKLKQEATDRLAQIAIEQARIAKLSSDLDARQTDLDKAVKHWNDIYSQNKVDKVFDRLMSENKMKHNLVFQVSTVGLNLTSQDVVTIRNEVSAVKNSASNAKYKANFKLSPSSDRIAAIAKDVAAAKNGGISGAFARMSLNDSMVVNDSYLISTTGDSLLALRNSLKRLNTERKAIFTVVRLVEKLSVSLSMKVFTDNGADFLQKDIRQTFSGGLTAPREIEFNFDQDQDISKPTKSFFSSDACQALDVSCLSTMKSKGLLNNVLSPSTGTLAAFLRSAFINSSQQSIKDLQQLNDGYEKTGWLASLARPTRYCYNDNLSKYDCTEETEAAAERKPVITRIELIYSVNMIQEMPENGLMPADFAVNNDFQTLALSVNDAKIHISLPIAQSRSVVFDADQEAQKIVNDMFQGVAVSQKDRLAQILSTKSNLFMNFATGIK